ncbi:MAG: hypothetical protein AB7J28_05560 [Hyphomonadaceae bacterium]
MDEALLIWGAALAAYILFRAWYDNWRGPLSTNEIERFVAAIAGTPGAAVNDLAIVRRFLEEDDGREFFMLNLVRENPNDAPDPETGAMVPGRILTQRYAKAFMPALFARAGHPAIVARPAGGYLDAWNAAPDPGWSVVGYMRYRSRRDMAALASDPRFHHIHPFKIAGVAQTFSFPTRPMIRTLLGPRVWIALLLALIAALTHLARLTLFA